MLKKLKKTGMLFKNIPANVTKKQTTVSDMVVLVTKQAPIYPNRKVNSHLLLFKTH